MTIDGLRILASAKSPLDNQPVSHVYLVVPKRRLPKGDRIRLAGSRGPLGRLCNVKEDGEGAYLCVANFKSADILKFCDEAEQEVRDAAKQ